MPYYSYNGCLKHGADIPKPTKCKCGSSEIGQYFELECTDSVRPQCITCGYGPTEDWVDNEYDCYDWWETFIKENKK